MVLPRALVQVNQGHLISRFIAKLFLMLLEMINPILIYKFTEFVEKNEEGLSKEEYRTAMMIAGALLGQQIFSRLLNDYVNFKIDLSNSVAGRSLKSLMFSKNFRMSTTGRRNYSFAQVLSLVDTDSDRLWGVVVQTSGMLQHPLEFAYCAFFIYYYLGWSILSGVVLWGLRFLFLRSFKDNKIEFNAKMQEQREVRI